MAYTPVCETTEELFESVFAESSLSQVIKFKLIHNSKLKMNPTGFCGKVIKTQDVMHKALANEVTLPEFIIEINDNVFIRLSDNTQKIVIDKVFAQMRFDFEKDKVILATPDVQEFSGILIKYNYEAIEAAKMETQTAFQQLAEENKR